MVLANEHYEHPRDAAPPCGLKALLTEMNLEGLDLERDQEPARDIDP